MELPPKIAHHLTHDTFPQRALLSGGGAFEIALQIAAKVQRCEGSQVSVGRCSDTLVLRDDGKSFKIDFSDAAKRDGQGEWENIRGLIRWVSQKPVAPRRIVILENLERCSREAPQALLKIIEEPPPRALFLFTTRNHYQILETILSRITVFCLPPEAVQEVDPKVKHFLETSDLIQRFRIIEELDQVAKKEKDKTIITNFMMELINAGRTQSQFHDRLPSLLQAHQDLRSHLNTRLVLEHLVLEWEG